MRIERTWMNTLAGWLALSTIPIAAGVAGPADAFDPKLCEDRHLVSQEMVEYHLAGAHWQAGVSSCLEQKNFRTILSGRQSAGDASLVTPAFIVPKGSKIKIDSENELEIGGVEVRFTFAAMRAGEKKVLHDSLIYLWNAPRIRKRDGCANIQTLPAYFAMREECLR